MVAMKQVFTTNCIAVVSHRIICVLPVVINTCFYYLSIPLQADTVCMLGQEPLTACMLADAFPQDQKQMLGEHLYLLIENIQPRLVRKITGALLELDNREVSTCWSSQRLCMVV